MPLDLSVQLYTLRDALTADFDGTLAALAELGYTQVEPFALVDFAEQLRSGLGAHHLTAPTTHVSLLKGDQEAIFALAVELGISTVIDPFVDPERWKSEQDILQVARELNAASEKGAGRGVRVGYHNHWWELESRVNGRHALEVLADALSPEVVLEVDTYWAYVGGADVPGLLRRLGERVVALHIKDGDGTRNVESQVAVGAGSLPVWDFIEAAPPDALLVVELDACEGSVIDAVRDSRTFLLAGHETEPEEVTA